MNILMIVSGDWEKDPRVVYEKEALERYGHNVEVYDWKREYTSKFSTIFRMILWWVKAYKDCRRKSFDVVHCHDFDTLPVGVMLKKKHRCKLVYDAHEMYAFMINSVWVLPVEKILLTNVHKCISISSTVTEYLKVLKAKDITQVRNCKPLIASEYYSPTENNGLRVSYFGILSETRMFPELVDIIGEIPDVQFDVGGYGLLYDEVERRSKDYENVHFHGYVTKEQVMDYTRDSDLVICMLNPMNKNAVLGMPNKLYECLVVGRPLMVTQKTLAGDFVSRMACGFPVRYDSDSIKNWLLYLIVSKRHCIEMGRNALRHAVREFNWEMERQKLRWLYENM